MAQMSTLTSEQVAQVKQAQKQGWAHFAPLEMVTTAPAAKLVKHAGVKAGQRVLDVACGTGVVAVTAARKGAKVTGLDLTPELLTRARENADMAQLEVEWREGDVEQLPFGDQTFDVVLSQFGHMFAPRPEVAAAEMLRVLRPGGTIAFSTWRPELFVGRSLELSVKYMPPPMEVPSPMLWGEPRMIRERLGEGVSEISFDQGTMWAPTLSPQHHRVTLERSAGPMIRLVQTLSASDPARLEAFRREYEALVSEYLEDNVVRQGFLITRARKK